MAVDDTKRLGYGGSAEIARQQVLITSGSFSTPETPSYLEPWSIPPSASYRSRVLHADGTESYTGEVSLDVTDRFLNVLSTTTLLGRYYQFDVGINDGESAEEMTDCFVTSLSLSGAAGGLVTASLGFISANAPQASISVANAFIRDDEPLGYWYSGNTDVRDWTLSMNQAATPMYRNANTKAPRYIKVGMVDYSLAVTTYDQVLAHSTISIKTKSFTLTGVTTSSEYAFAGVTDLGNYRHTFETAASAAGGSGGIIIT
jgi:hypothetical protein